MNNCVHLHLILILLLDGQVSQVFDDVINKQETNGYYYGNLEILLLVMQDMILYLKWTLNSYSAVLINMVDDIYLSIEGVARSVNYEKNTEDQHVQWIVISSNEKDYSDQFSGESST